MTADPRAAWRRAGGAQQNSAVAAPVRIAVEAQGEHPGIGFRQQRQAAEAPAPIHLPAEAHVMTFAPTGAGKMVNCIAPVLLQYAGPAIVLDPKGEIAAVTARRRREMGQDVHVIDPFGVSGLPASSFNPLDLVEPGAPDAPDEAKVIGNALMPAMTEPKDVFWRSRAVHMLTASALAAVSDYPPGQRNLLTARDVLHELARCAARSGVGTTGERPSIASSNPDVARVNDLLNLGAIETIGGILHTALEGVGFVQGSLVERSLSTSSFRLDDVTEGVPMTIYLVLPPHMLTSHGAMLRLWMSTLFNALMRRRAGPTLPTLLMLDETAQLGSFAPLHTAITLLRGYGVQTWSFWQDVTQLAQLYPSSYLTMLNNCRMLQIFGATSGMAWRQSGGVLGLEFDRLPPAEGDKMVLVLDGQSMLVDRIDYRHDPELAPLADPNPLHAAPTYPLRRPRPNRVPTVQQGSPQTQSAISEISAALGRL